MTHSLTPSEQAKVEQAAKDFIESKYEWVKLEGITHPDVEEEREAFVAGASFATSDPSVLKELLGKFAEWERDNIISDGAPKRIYKPDMKRYTTEELISKYIQETIKPKEDAGR